MKIELELNDVSYHIEVEPSCFTPYKHGVTEKTDKSPGGKEKITCLGYPSTLSRAIQMIIREEMATSKDTVTLLEYIERYENALTELRTQVDFV